MITTKPRAGHRRPFVPAVKAACQRPAGFPGPRYASLARLNSSTGEK